MDYIRTPLIVALLVVSYLLVLAWNEDYPSEPPASAQQQVPGLNDSVLQDTEIDIGPRTVPDASLNNELTTPEALQNASSELTVEEVKTDLGVEQIRVVTDVLTTSISLQGGHLQYAALNEYPISLTNQAPLELFVQDASRYFVAKSGLIGANGFDSSRNGPTPVYSATASNFQLQPGEEQLQVDLQYTRNNVTLVKRYTFTRGSYLIDVDFLITNNGDEEWNANFFAQFERTSFPDPTSAGGFGAVSYLGAVVSTQEEPYEKVDFDDMDEGAIKVTDSQGWIAFIQHYFVSAWVPKTEAEHTFQLKSRGGKYLMGYVDPRVSVTPGATETVGTQLYVGPKILDDLQAIAPNLDLTIDFGILWLIAKPLYLILDFIHDYVGNWGIAIILLTILIKAIFFHLSAASYRSMANMRKVAPEMTRIKELYGDDRQKMSQAMMELYKKEKINPLGGCLPILVQMPVFIALYWVLLESVELRQAPFFFWIQDLSIKDPFFILPLAMGATMFLQMHLNPTPIDPIQARVMKMMPVIFTVFFLWFPAGLVLYWLVNNILSIAQQWVITRKIEKEAAKAG